MRWRPSSWGTSSSGSMAWEYQNMNSESRPLFIFVRLMISKVEYKLFKFRRSLHYELYKLIMKLYLTWSMMLIFWHKIMRKYKTVFLDSGWQKIPANYVKLVNIFLRRLNTRHYLNKFCIFSIGIIP